MKQEHIPTRRQPVRKTLHARFFNKTKPRKQRAAAAALPIEEAEGSGINIARSLFIIFLIHIIAIGLIFFHKYYLSKRTTAPVAAVSTTTGAPSSEIDNLPQIGNGDRLYRVEKGDNFTIIAAKYQIAEADLRNANPGIEIRAGVAIRVPKAKRIVALPHPEVTAINENRPENESERGLVEILPPVGADDPQLIRPITAQDNPIPVAQADSGRSHTVKSGDNIWRIATKYKVDQKKLMELNGIKDPTKLRIGQKLNIP